MANKKATPINSIERKVSSGAYSRPIAAKANSAGVARTSSGYNMPSRTDYPKGGRGATTRATQNGSVQHSSSTRGTPHNTRVATPIERRNTREATPRTYNTRSSQPIDREQQRQEYRDHFTAVSRSTGGIKGTNRNR